MRKKANRNRDKRRFSRTASKSKKMNVDPSIPRGGIRL